MSPHLRSGSWCPVGMTNATRGDRVISGHPHPAFERLATNGYRVEYLAADASGPLTVLVLRGDRVVGSSAFHPSAADLPRLHPQNTYVEVEHRRRGVGDALLIFAEQFSGRVITDAGWGDGDAQLHSPLVLPFLKRLNRPFGVVPSIAPPVSA